MALTDHDEPLFSPVAGMDSEGVYRLSGQHSVIARLLDMFNSGKIYNTHTIKMSNLVKCTTLL